MSSSSSTVSHGVEELQSFCQLHQRCRVDETDWAALVVLKVPLPENEEERIRVLRESQYLDKEEDDPAHNRLTKIAAKAFKAAMTFISIVDVDKQWLRSRVGTSLTHTHRNQAFCSYTILESTPDVMVIPDALLDERFKNNALVVGPPYIRFYAGGSLMVEGMKIGSFCVIDMRPRHDFDHKQQAILYDMSCIAAQIIAEQRRHVLKTELEVVKINMSILYSIKGSLTQLSSANEDLQSIKSLIRSKDEHEIETEQAIATFNSELNRFNCLLELAMEVAMKVLVDHDARGRNQMRMEACNMQRMKENIEAALLHSKIQECSLNLDVCMKGFQYLFSHPGVVLLLIVSSIQYFMYLKKTIHKVIIQKSSDCENMNVATDGQVNNIINTSTLKKEAQKKNLPSSPFRQKNHQLCKQFEKGFLQVIVEAEDTSSSLYGQQDDSEAQFRLLAIQCILSWIEGNIEVKSHVFTEQGANKTIQQLVFNIPMLLSNSSMNQNKEDDKSNDVRLGEISVQKSTVPKYPVDVRSICQQYIYSLLRQVLKFPNSSIVVQPEEN